MTMRNYITRILWALLPAVCVAALVLPAARLERNQWGIGGEWLLVALVFVGCFFWEGRK